MDFFHFKDPAFLWLLLSLPFIALLFGKTGPEAAVQFSSTALFKEISHSRRSRPGVWLLMIRLFTLAFIIAALANCPVARRRSVGVGGCSGVRRGRVRFVGGTSRSSYLSILFPDSCSP